MFHSRSQDFSNPQVTAIVGHLRAIERELGEIGKKAGRGASASASAAGDQIAAAAGLILNDMVDRLGRGRRAAADGAADLGKQALKISSRTGSEALSRIAGQAQQRPLAMLAVAIGVGLLIGAASRRNWSRFQSH